MKKISISTLVMTVSSLLLTTTINAQYGPNVTDPEKKTKIVRDCEYEVIPGLAEITTVKITRAATESMLQYDEHEVLFKFTPMEGGEVLEMLKDAELEFKLRSRAASIPVGPEYIQRKNLKEGTKYAMNLLQTKNKGACLEQFTYESKALDNDLFEAKEHLIPFIKADYENQLAKKEQAHNQRQMEYKVPIAKGTVSPLPEETTIGMLGDLEKAGVDITTMTQEEMRIYVAKKLKIRQEEGELMPAQKNDLGINIDSLRAATEEELRGKYKDELKAVESIKEEKTTKFIPKKSMLIQQARKAAREKERQVRRQAKIRAQKEKERQTKLEKLKDEITIEIDAKIQAEIATKKMAVQRQLEDEEQEALALARKKQTALDRIQQIEQEMSDQIIKEAKRKECVFGERISGVIEVINVRKARTSEESYLGYTEYEVLVSFRPDNWSDLSKKEKANWDKTVVFSLDPKGVNAHPSTAYIRKYRLFKASKYKGFAQKLETGICNEFIFYSPDLPIDAKQLELK